MSNHIPYPCLLESHPNGNPTRQKNHDLPSESILGVDILILKFARSLDHLGSKIRQNKAELADFNMAHRLLGSLPLSTDEFAVHILRLTNAHSYCLQNEQGAAMYELRMMRSCLSSLGA
jgi:hypothetical protein